MGRARMTAAAKSTLECQSIPICVHLRSSAVQPVRRALRWGADCGKLGAVLRAGSHHRHGLSRPAPYAPPVGSGFFVAADWLDRIHLARPWCVGAAPSIELRSWKGYQAV